MLAKLLEQHLKPTDELIERVIDIQIRNVSKATIVRAWKEIDREKIAAARKKKGLLVGTRRSGS